MSEGGRERPFDESKVSLRWGIPWLDGGYTVVMNLMLTHYQEVGITNTEMMFIVHLASFAFESENGECRPSVTQTIRERMGYRSNEGVLKVQHSLEEKGMIEVTRRPGQTSLYDLSPFAKAIEKVALKAQQETEKTPSQKLTTQEEEKQSRQQKLTSSRQQKLTRTRKDNKKSISPSSTEEGGKRPLSIPSEEMTREKPGSPNGFLKEAMGMLRERCGARGYRLGRSEAGRDGADLKAMLAEGYSLEDIFALWDKKAAEPRNQGRHVPMAWIRGDIGPFVAAKRRGGNGDHRTGSGLPSSLPRCFEEGEPLPSQGEVMDDGVRCSHVSCIYHRYRVTGKVTFPGQCTRWAGPREAEMVAEAGAT